MYKICLAFIFIFLFNNAMCQDKIILKDSTTLTGQIEKIEEEIVFLKTEYGFLNIPMKDVQRIIFKDPNKASESEIYTPDAKTSEKAPIIEINEFEIGNKKYSVKQIESMKKHQIYQGVGSLIQTGCILYFGLQEQSWRMDLENAIEYGKTEADATVLLIRDQQNYRYFVIGSWVAGDLIKAISELTIKDKKVSKYITKRPDRFLNSIGYVSSCISVFTTIYYPKNPTYTKIEDYEDKIKKSKVVLPFALLASSMYLGSTIHDFIDSSRLSKFLNNSNFQTTIKPTIDTISGYYLYSFTIQF